MNPAIGEICRLFFYGASNRMGHEFPDEFGSQIPEMAIALVITAVSLHTIYKGHHLTVSQIKCALDEWAEGTFKTVQFTADVYKTTYEAAAKLIAKVKENAYHDAKFQKTLCDWAVSRQVDHHV